MIKFFERKNKRKSEKIWVIAGLGNPGPEYADTRHNCGFLTIDKIIEKIAANQKITSKFKGKCISCEYEENKVILVKPETYMNNSGECINAVLNWFKTDPEHLIIIYDDFDIAKGQIRIRPKGSAGTHNGMRSVIQYLGTEEFARIRVGIGPKGKDIDIIKFVLGHFSQEEKIIMDKSFDRAAEAVLDILKNGTENAMNLYNGTNV